MITTLERRNENASSISHMTEHLDANVLTRSLVLALIIGSILTFVNQPEAIFGDELFEKLPSLLAFATPFLVVMLSQLGAIKQAVIDRRHGQTPNETTRFISTMMGHNIPFRALAISLIAGSVNSVIILINTIFQTGDITNVPLPVLVQSYLLPFIFGAFSQALTYRRCVV